MPFIEQCKYRLYYYFMFLFSEGEIPPTVKYHGGTIGSMMSFFQTYFNATPQICF